MLSGSTAAFFLIDFVKHYFYQHLLLWVMNDRNTFGPGGFRVSTGSLTSQQHDEVLDEIRDYLPFVPVNEHAAILGAHGCGHALGDFASTLGYDM